MEFDFSRGIERGFDASSDITGKKDRRGDFTPKIVTASVAASAAASAAARKVSGGGPYAIGLLIMNRLDPLRSPFPEVDPNLWLFLSLTHMRARTLSYSSESKISNRFRFDSCQRNCWSMCPLRSAFMSNYRASRSSLHSSRA